MFGDTEVTSSSPIKIFPDVTCSRPAIILKSVVFPQPEGPNKVMNSPALISKLKEFITYVLSNFLFIFCNFIDFDIIFLKKVFEILDQVSEMSKIQLFQLH